MTPSFLGLMITGFLNLLAVVMILVYSSSITAPMMIQYILLLTVSIGVHSLLHFQQEIFFDFNPLEGKWTPTPKSMSHMNHERIEQKEQFQFY